MVKHEKKDGEQGDGVEVVSTVVYKVNLHCPQCAREVRKPLIRTQGIRTVDVDIERGEISVSGRVDAKKIRERIEKISKKKVEMVTPRPMSMSKETFASEKKLDIQERILSTTIMKVNMHCGKCEYDLKRKLLKLKGVYTIKTDIKAQSLAVEGTMEPPKLVEYIRKKIHKHAEIVTMKRENKEEKKGSIKELDSKIVETKRSTDEGEEKKLEVQVKESSVPYIVHYGYAPPLFSDENPNACSIL